MAFRYETGFAKDTAKALADMMNQFARQGGRVIHVSWRPGRENGEQIPGRAGYTVVAEFEDTAVIETVANILA